MSASYAPGGYAVILNALRNSNVGMTLTIWKDGYRLWRPLDAEYSRKDDGWIMEIPLTEIVSEAARIASGVKDGKQIPVERISDPNPTRAALEECVRTMDETLAEIIAKIDRGTGMKPELIKVTFTESDLRHYRAKLESFRATVRNALQETEK